MIYKFAWWYIIRSFRNYKDFKGITHKVNNDDYIVIRLDEYLRLKGIEGEKQWQ